MCGALAAALLNPGCFLSSEGISPPLDTFYFPTGVVVSPARKALYVVSSDFDLQYSGGTVLLIDLTSVRKKVFQIASDIDGGMDVDAACRVAEIPAENGTYTNNSQVLHPGPCNPLPVKGFITRSAIIGAFASGAIFVPDPNSNPDPNSDPDDPPAHLFVPVRGDPSVTYFDVGGEENKLDCGAGDDGRCRGDHRIGEDPDTNDRGVTFPTEPVGIAASENTGNTALMVAHQVDHAASLIVDRWDSREPTLEYYTTNAAEAPMEVAALPIPKATEAPEVSYRPGFLMTYRAAPQIDIFRYIDDSLADPGRPYLSRVGSISVNTNAGGSDSRGIAIDSEERKSCEQACISLGGSTDCLQECVDTPLRLYVANRTPPSLLVGRIRTEFTADHSAVFDVPSIHESVPLAVGASKVALGKVIDETGALVQRVFAVAFDSRLIFSYDPQARRVDAIIHTGRGPHAIAFDTGDDGGELHSYMYVGHFTDSYVGVVDLDMRRAKTFGSMVLTLGTPKPPESSE